MQAEGIIEPVTTPTDWSSGMVPVARPGKSKLGFVLITASSI